MGIEQIKGVGPSTVKKLENAGVRTLADVRGMDTELVAKRTGLTKRRLNEWRMEARLMKVLDDVKGIGPATKKRLKDADIHSLEDLAKASADQVAQKARVAQDRAKAWQKDARRLLNQTQKRVGEEGRNLQKRGAGLAKKARKQASRTAQQAEGLVDSARSGTRRAAKRGRDAADSIIEQVRERQASPVAAEKPSSESAEPVYSEPSTPQPGTNGGSSNGAGSNGQSGFLTRLKRIFQVR